MSDVASAGSAPVAAASTQTPSTPQSPTSGGAEPAKASSGGVQPQRSEQKPEAQSAQELFEIKIGNKTKKLTREEALQYAQMGHVATQRFQEAAELKRQAESVIGRMRDPKQVIQTLQDPALGLTKEQIRDAFEEWYAAEFIEPEKLTPEQKALREKEAELQKYKEADKKREEDRIKQEQESMTTQAREELQKQIIEALEKSALPRTNFTIRRLAYWMQRAGSNAPMEAVVGMVRNDINSFIKDMVESSDGDALIGLLGEGVVQKLRKHDLAQLQKIRQSKQTVEGERQSPGSQSQRSERPTMADVSKRMRELQRTGRY